MDETARPRTPGLKPEHAPDEALGPGERPQDADPARRFAYEMAFDPSLEGLRWPEAEPLLRSRYPSWVEHHGDDVRGEQAWDRIKGRVKDAWEAALSVERATVDPRTGQWDERSDEYRGLWQARYGWAGARWDEDEAGYRYGYEMGFDPRFHGRPWADVAPGLRSGFGDWAASTGYRITDHETLWDRLKDGIREAWERATGGERSKGSR